MRMRGDEIIQVIDFVTLQRVEHNFAFAGVARVDQDGLAAGCDDQNRITFDWSDVEHVDLQLSGRLGRARTPPRQAKLPEPHRAGAEQQHQHRNRTSASACTSFHLSSPLGTRRSLTSTMTSPDDNNSRVRGKAVRSSFFRCAFEVFPHGTEITWGEGRGYRATSQSRHPLSLQIVDCCFAARKISRSVASLNPT